MSLYSLFPLSRAACSEFYSLARDFFSLFNPPLVQKRNAPSWYALRRAYFFKPLLKNPHNETSSSCIKSGPRERMQGPKERFSSPCGKESRGWSVPEASSDIGNDARGIRKLSAPAYSCIRARTHARFLKPYNPGNVLARQRRAAQGERTREREGDPVNYRVKHFEAAIRMYTLLLSMWIWLKEANEVNKILHPGITYLALICISFLTRPKKSEWLRSLRKCSIVSHY